MALFLLQVVLPGGDVPCSVIQALDQSPLDMGWMVRLVSVCGLPVGSHIQAAILSPLKQGVEKGQASILLHLHSEHDGQSYTVEVVWSPSTVPLFTIQQVPSTYLFQSQGFDGTILSVSSSKNSMYRFATTAETGEPIAAPSHCS